MQMQLIIYSHGFDIDLEPVVKPTVNHFSLVFRLAFKGFTCESSFEVLCLSYFGAFADNSISCQAQTSLQPWPFTCLLCPFRLSDVVILLAALFFQTLCPMC